MSERQTVEHNGIKLVRYKEDGWIVWTVDDGNLRDAIDMFMIDMDTIKGFEEKYQEMDKDI